MLEQLVESWQINHRVTVKLLAALSDDALPATLSTRGGRDVARQLAHVHGVRLAFAEITSKTNRSANLSHFIKGETPGKKQLLKATLKQTGHQLTDELKWGLWDWDKL